MVRTIALLSLVATLGGCLGAPDAPRRQPVRQSTAVFTPRADGRQCLAQLGATHANFTPLPDRYFGAGCATLNTVQLASLTSDGAALALTNLGAVSCPLANTFAGWARFGADRAARQILGSALVRIETMGSYSCRNVAGSGRRSAHATADAIDIAGFVLADGRRITVARSWHNGSPVERRFLDVVYASACKRFGTVLGPNYNAAHADHLHVEIGGSGNEGSTFCR